jgi:hypothetical protein
MKQLLLGCAIIAGTYATMPIQPASARDYKYCLFEGRSGGASDCSFDTYSQCMASASGRVAECKINPMYIVPRRHR